MELDKNQKSGLIQLISYVIGKRVNDEATDLSYTELLNLKNELQKDEPEEEAPNYILIEDGIHIVGSHKVVLNEKIRQEELHEYNIVHRESLIDDLYKWIAEADGVNKQMMIDDLDYLKAFDDDYIFSSVSTNSYIVQGDSEFDQTCEELIKLNGNL